jgi:hypothetical protein
MKEKTITELWIEQAKEKANWTLRISSDEFEFKSENLFEYTFSFGFSEDKIIEDVIIFLRTYSDEEYGYTFTVQNKKIMWENNASHAAYFPDDLKEHLNKCLIENTYSVRI